jgi:isocitrate dehydrogenase
MKKNTQVPIAVAEGDGIGPEIMAATLRILNEAGASLEIRKVEIGEKVYLRGIATGIEQSTWETIRNTKAFLKAPITTPQGGGFKSLNVTIRTALGLFANVRPCVAYYPFVDTNYPNMDVVIVRENEEDLYTGIEYRQSPDGYHALKVITESGSEKIIRFAFEYALAYKRKKVTCFTKDNILKYTDGIFHKLFDEIGQEFPSLEKEHWIVDIGAAKLADTPTAFDVVVMPNLYGDILSDVAAQIAGSVGLAGSANIGIHGAMFEAIHGSAPRRAGQNLANPSGLLLAAIMMLVHIGQPEVAELIHNAWLKTLEDGIHTYDIFKEGLSKEKVGTKEFAQAVINRLGSKPSKLKPVDYSNLSSSWEKIITKMKREKILPKKETIGIDIYVQWNGSVEELQKKINPLGGSEFTLKLIGNRGVNVWPNVMSETFCVDQWRCRYFAKQSVNHQQLVSLLKRFADAGIDFIHTENLCLFDGKIGFRE